MRFPIPALLLAGFLAACGAKANDPNEALQAVKPPIVYAGTQPIAAHGIDSDWTADLDGTVLRIGRPNANLQINVERTGDAATLSWAGEGDTFVLTNVSCLDGKSPTAYPMTAALNLGGETMKGCAAFKDPQPPKP